MHSIESGIKSLLTGGKHLHTLRIQATISSKFNHPFLTQKLKKKDRNKNALDPKRLPHLFPLSIFMKGPILSNIFMIHGLFVNPDRPVK